MTEKRTRIRYELKESSFEFASLVVDFLDRSGQYAHIEFKLHQAIKSFYLPLAIAPEHAEYRTVVLESLTALQAQIDLIQNLSGIVLQRHNVPLPMAHPAGEIDGEKIPLTEAVMTVAALEAEVKDLLEKLASGTPPATIAQSLSNLEPDEEGDWTEAMWELYDTATQRVNEASYQDTFES